MPHRQTVRQTFDLTVMLSLVLAVAALYFAKDVFIPLALAGLLSFLLAPLATRLERAGLSRIPSTLVLVTVAFGLIFCVGWVVGDQLYALGEDLPKYQDEIVHKVQRLHGTGGVIGRNFSRFMQAIDTANNDTSKAPALSPTTPGGPPPGSSSNNPLYTVAQSQPASALQNVLSYAKLSLGPAATAGLVLVVVIFLLLKREDVRDRAIRLISGGRYTVTTKALDDAATRISKYVVAQSIVNGTFGLTIGVGLWLIGETAGHGVSFPSFALWGLLAAVLRFVPYVGPAVAAIIPLGLSLAVYPGFSVFTVTVAMIVIVELISNNVMEPWLYGASTGLSAVAILVTTIFWTWLWGPVGLLLSTPLTVCLVVLGKHVPQLKFLDVMLSDEPALPADISLYQRLLAQNSHEAIRLMDHQVAERGERVFDEVIIPALRLMRRERNENRLSADDESAVYRGAEQLLTHVAAKLTVPPATESGGLMIAVPSHHRSEEMALGMLTNLMGGRHIETVSTRMLPVEIEALIQEKQPAVVCIAILPPGGVVQARYLCRRLRKRFPDLKIVVTYLGRARNFDALLVKLRSSGASYVMTSLVQTRNQVISLASGLQKQS